MKKVTVPFFISHQGCPHTCVFCDQRTISGSTGELPSTHDLLSKVDSWRRTAGERPLEVAFFGGTFTALPVAVQDKLLQPLQRLLASGEIRSIRISTRSDCIDDTTVTRLAGQGVTVIELGVQSMDDGVLERSGRGHTAADSQAAIRCIRKGGLTVGAQLMPGLPGDTSAKSLHSLQRVIAAGAGFVRIYPVVVLRGTELARRFQAGEFSPLSLDEGVQLCKVLLHESIKAAIPVIRIGLQADDGLNADTVLAGCRHPALGQLVRSELYFDLLCKLVLELPDGQTFSIRCHPSRVSDVAGPGRTSLARVGGGCCPPELFLNRP
ncbi:MAG: radical SAM protein [Desulfuromonadales bacterium]|nr:radical SAM protein [Desulfuromonadales bacterium]